MNKRFWMAFAACYVVAQVLGFVIHGVLLADTYEALASVWRPKEQMEAMMPIMMATGLIWVFLFCLIFTKGYEGKGIGEGLRYGLLIGLFVSVMQAFDSYVIYPIPLDLAITWFVSGVIFYVILGAVLAAIYRR